MKSADLILKNSGEAYLHSNSLTKGNLWIVSKPYYKFNWLRSSHAEKMKLINDVLDNSKVGIERPLSYSEVGSELFKSFGISRWTQLFKNAKLCFIRVNEDGNYTFTPSIYDSSSVTHEGLKDGIEMVSIEAKVEDIIATLERVIEKSS